MGSLVPFKKSTRLGACAFFIGLLAAAALVERVVGA